MREEVEQLLPLIRKGNISDTEIQAITNKLRQCIKEDSSRGKEYGELLSRVNQALKEKNRHIEINWVPVSKGFLAIGHKPGGKISFVGLKDEGATAVLTLLKENEGALLIGKQLRMLEIEWIWFPFSASNNQEDETITAIYNLYEQLSSLLQSGAKIYIHCSAGIHRTGMITYGFLRYLGFEKKEAYTTIQQLREITADQVGEDRLMWADQFGKEDPENK